MPLHKAAKATLVTIGILAGVAAAPVVLYFAAVILVVLLGLWVAARVVGAAAKMIPRTFMCAVLTQTRHRPRSYEPPRPGDRSLAT